MGHLERLLSCDLDIVHIQILQTISILIQNVSNTNQLCSLSFLTILYIMSHKAMNTIISKTYNFGNSEIVSYYVAFLKSLAVRLNDETLMFFFNEVINIIIIRNSISFLYILKLLSSLTIAKVLFVLLYLPSPLKYINVFPHNLLVKHPMLLKLLTSNPYIIYFAKLACFLRDLWLEIDSFKDVQK